MQADLRVVNCAVADVTTGADTTASRTPTGSFMLRLRIPRRYPEPVHPDRNRVVEGVLSQLVGRLSVVQKGHRIHPQIEQSNGTVR